MLGASKLAVFDDDGHFSLALAKTLVADVKLSPPAPDVFLNHLMSFIAELPQIVQQEQSFQLFSESTRHQLVIIFRGFLEPQSAQYLSERAPILSDLFVESVTYFLEPVNNALFGVGCPGTRDNVRCFRTECVPTYIRNPTSLTFGTCGLLVCAQNRLACQLTGIELKRTRRNFCALTQKLPYCLPISCSGVSSSYERCRLCSTTLHRACALNLFSEGNYAFPLEAGSQLFCSQCIITLPQVITIFATVASTLANTGTPLEYLVVIPTHTTEAAELHLRSLQDAAEGFVGIKFAWLGDAEGEEEFSGLSGTPVAHRDPERNTKLALREELRHSVQRERDLRVAHANSARSSESGDTPEGSIPEGNYGYSPAVAFQAPSSGAAQPALGVTHPSHSIPTVGVAPNSLLPHPLGELTVEPQLAPGEPATYPPGAYIPPHLRPNATTHASIPAPLRAVPPSVVNPQPVTAGLLPTAAVPARGQVGTTTSTAPAAGLQPDDLSSDLLRLRVTEELQRQTAQRHDAAGATYALMLAAVTPTMGISELVTGEIDGLAVTDLDSPSALRREMRENYSGNGTTKADKTVMRRLMQVDTLGDSAELRHTPFRASSESVTMDGNKLKVRDRLQFPRRDRYLAYCRKRSAEWRSIMDSGHGVFAATYESQVYHRRTALLIQARYEFLIELVDHAGLEWSWCSWESLYVFITTRYVSAWELQPFTGAAKLDRDLLRFQWEIPDGDRRDVVRRYVVDTLSPSQVLEALQRVGVLGSTSPPGPSIQMASSPSPQPPRGAPAAPLSRTVATSSPTGTLRCPLCLGPYQYHRVDHYDRPPEEPITQTCGKEKVIQGVKKKCILKHAFSGPLRTPCEHTETVA
ncbi:hypothetical protein CYMTET_48772 [Cymbomonas tetramitiformis]|uniref:Uncharacterized protein n=1 Tax=Cymbomonas tetramitiformis TaxID=36881 RepID=A0AAE0BTA6_9CHLO|nr:hypothetical protein CYMTET_48772 [Cymbomonas tetramitiformis]